MSGPHSLSMFCLTWDVHLECQQHSITLLVRHILDQLNVLANVLLRRLQVIVTEWSLHPSIMHQMFSIWYIPIYNHKLVAFVSPIPDPQTVAVGVCLSPDCGNATSAS